MALKMSPGQQNWHKQINTDQRSLHIRQSLRDPPTAMTEFLGSLEMSQLSLLNSQHRDFEHRYYTSVILSV